MAGLLRIRGSIDLEQFRPDGESDADTSKVKVTVSDTSFSFAADGKSFKRTNAFIGASVRGASKDLVIDSKNPHHGPASGRGRARAALSRRRLAAIAHGCHAGQARCL